MLYQTRDFQLTTLLWPPLTPFTITLQPLCPYKLRFSADYPLPDHASTMATLYHTATLTTLQPVLTNCIIIFPPSKQAVEWMWV